MNQIDRIWIRHDTTVVRKHDTVRRLKMSGWASAVTGERERAAWHMLNFKWI